MTAYLINSSHSQHFGLPRIHPGRAWKKGFTQAAIRFLSIIFLLNFLLAGTSLAQTNLFPRLGGQRAGTSSFSFLKIGIGARAVGMGGAFTAIADDASSMFWNPAGIAQRVQSRDMILSHSKWIADFELSSAAIAFRFGNVHHIGFSALALYAPAMEITTEYQPDGTGDYFNYGDMLLGLTYALRMTDRFSFGVTTKLVEEQLADLYMRNILLDVGTFYRTGFRDLNFAVALLNFGTPSQPEGSYTYLDINADTVSSDYQSFSPPTIFRLGVAYEWLQTTDKKLTSSIQLNHPVDNAESISLGWEFIFHRMMILRAGQIFGEDAQSWSLGFGIRWAGFRLDYSYSDLKELTQSQRFSLSWEL